MSIRSRLTRKGSRRSTVGAPFFKVQEIAEAIRVAGLGIWGQHIEPSFSNRKAYLEAFDGWVYACVDSRARDVANIDLVLMKNQNNDVVEVPEHEALSLLRHPNALMTFRQLIYLTVAYQDLLGEEYWYLGSKTGGIPTAIWPLRPDLITPMIDKSGKKIVAGYEYKAGGQSTEVITIEPQEIAPFRYPDPLNPYRGRGILQAAGVQYDTDKQAKFFQRNFFKNAGIPSLLLATDQVLHQKDLQRLQGDWSRKFSGADNAAKVAFAGGGLKPYPLSVPYKDMQYLEIRNAIRDEILAIFKVPQVVIGTTQGVIEANAEQTRLQYKVNVIEPLMQQLVDNLNTFYLPLFKGTENLFFSYIDPTPENVQNKLAYYDNGLKYGWLTIDEVRELEHLDPMSETETQEQVTARLKAKRLSRIKAQPQTPKTVDVIAQRKVDALTPKLRKAIGAMMVAIRERQQQAKPKKEEVPFVYDRAFKESIWQQQVHIAEQAVPGLEKALSKALTVAGNEAATIYEQSMSGKELAKAKKKNAAIAATIFPTDAFNKLVADALKTYLLPVMVKQYRFMKDDFLPDLKKRFDSKRKAGSTTSTAELEAMFNTYLTTLLPELDATSIDELAAVISAGSVDGLSVAEIAANIRHSPAFENLRAELIARTEALRAANYAGRQAMIDFGAKKVEWYTAQDELVCTTCGDLDGEVVAIEDAFVGVGDAIPGLNPNVPSGHAKVNVEYPPVHPRCRCTLLPTESDFSL